MNNLETIFEKHKGKPTGYVADYLQYLKKVVDSVAPESIGNFIEILLDARSRGATVFFIGNGGSAATANHFANDIGIGTRSRGKPFRAVSLCDNSAVLTCIGNDFGYDQLFVKQLESLLQPQDVVVAISASGNSANLLRALEYANEKGAITVGLTGFSGGKMQALVKHNIHIPSDAGEYGPVEDLHMIVDHIVGSFLNLHCRFTE